MIVIVRKCSTSSSSVGEDGRLMTISPGRDMVATRRTGKPGDLARRSQGREERDVCICVLADFVQSIASRTIQEPLVRDAWRPSCLCILF